MNIQNLIIDINKPIKIVPTANIGEVASRFLKIDIVDNNVPFDLEGVDIKVYGKKPDGTIIYNNATVLDSAKGTVMVTITSQMLTVVGDLKLTLSLSKRSAKLATKAFTVKVEDSIINDSAIESTDEFTALGEALQTIETWNGKFDEEYIKVKDKYEGLEQDYAVELTGVKSELVAIVYQLPLSNGIDDTNVIQDALDNYSKVQLNGNYIVSQLTISKSVEIIGKNSRVDKITQKTDSSNPLITANTFFNFNNISVIGNNRQNIGVLFNDKDVYSGTGVVKNVTIKGFETGLHIGLNRNMLMGDNIEILNCVNGCEMKSNDNLISKLNIGDCNVNLKITSGGGNVFDSCCFYRSNQYSIYLDHQAYYSTFNGCSIDSNQQNAVYIKQVDTNVSQRGHKFIACSLFNNSMSSVGTYSDFVIDGAKGVCITSCNFFTYDTNYKVKYFVNVMNNGSINFLSNSYDITTTIYYTTGITNDKTKCCIVDNNNFNLNTISNFNNRLNIAMSSTSSLMLQSSPSGLLYSPYQLYASGRMLWGDGTTTPTLAMSRYDNASLSLTGNLYINGKLGVQNAENATTLGSVSRKIEIFNKDGVSLGFMPVYNSIN